MDISSDLGSRSRGMKILLVDDHVLIREAMRGLVRELDGVDITLEAETARQASDLLVAHPDISLILLDLRLPDRDGLEMLSELRAKYPGIAVVMLSAFNDRDNVVKSLDAGAQGFIAKTATRDVLLNALRLVLAGGIYIPPEILTASGAPMAQPPKSAAREGRHRPADLGITERQMDVLALIMQGKSNKLICRQLDLAEPTVKNHVSAILKALNASNRTEAALAVAALGWTFPPPSK
jgi:DNA-binding NarL/FixJ family response regulator